jgi:uncharacterized protein (DUF1778 family)
MNGPDQIFPGTADDEGEIIRLTADEWAQLWRLLHSPPKPTGKLQRAIEEHSRLLGR